MFHDPREALNDEILGDPFSDGVTFSGTATVPGQVAGLPSIHTVNVIYSTQESIDFSSLPNLTLPPGSAAQLETANDKFYFGYSFQQFFSIDEQGRGWGLFGQLGVSDGAYNAIESSAVIGFGGNSFIPSRKDDRWGIAAFRYNFSDDLIGGLSLLPGNPELLRDEFGVETYYDFQLNRFFSIGANLQFIRPGIPGRETATFGSIKTRFSF